MSNALCQAAALYHLAADPEAAPELARQAVSVARDEGFTYPLAVGRILAGWALARTGNAAEGLEQMHQGLAGHRESGANMDRPYYLALLAEAELAAARELLGAGAASPRAS